MPGGWRGTISGRWDIGPGRPNGGYLLALALAALRKTSPYPDALTATAHYLKAPAPGPVDIPTELIRTGRSHASLEGRLVQGGSERLRLLATFGDLARADGPSVIDAGPPELPPPDACIARSSRLAPGMVATGMINQVDLRLRPDIGWLRGERSGTAMVAGWVRFADGRPTDSASLALFADAFPPAVFEVVEGARWIPTVELTVHLRALPAPGWLRGVFRTRFLMSGYLEEDGELWDETDRLVAQSRQLAMVLPAPPVGEAGK